MTQTERVTAEQIYCEMYPEYCKEGLIFPRPAFTLNEMGLRPIHSEVKPNEADLSVKIGPTELKIALMSAAMDTLASDRMSIALSEVGACGIIYRTPDPQLQMEWLKNALSCKPMMIYDPVYLKPDDKIIEAEEIVRRYGHSIIPVIDDDKMLQGVLFTEDIVFRVDGRRDEPAKKWMTPFKSLRTINVNATLREVRKRIENVKRCNILPAIDDDGRLHGAYFKVDFFKRNKVALHNERLLVGIATGVNEEDINDRVVPALKMGVGIIVIDSSHGNCPDVINQAQKIVKLANGQAAVVAGNIADVDGYLRLAEVGVDAVKFGIGSGSICTTSQVTGAGYPIFTLLREISYTRKLMQKREMHIPKVIADGGINGPGDMSKALAAGADACMAGKWLVGCTESLAYETYKAPEGYVYYRGMASLGAIKDRSSDRYGSTKKAAEGVEGKVPYRGNLKDWIFDDIELLQGGFAHAGAKDITALQAFGEKPENWGPFSSNGQSQINTRVTLY